MCKELDNNIRSCKWCKWDFKNLYINLFKIIHMDTFPKPSNWNQNKIKKFTNI